MGKRESTRATGRYKLENKGEPPELAKPMKLSDPNDPLGGDWSPPAPRSPAPPPPPDAPPTVSGAIAPEQVARVIRASGTKFRACWEQSGGTGEVKVKLSITIAAGGSVSAASVSGASGELQSCLAGVARGLTFPAPGGTVTITYPMTFRAD
jgi:hypothetical protein